MTRRSGRPGSATVTILAALLLSGCFGTTDVDRPLPAPPIEQPPVPLPAPADPVPDPDLAPEAPVILAADLPVGAAEEPLAVPDGRVQLTVWISNQSFDVDPVHLVGVVDGTTFVDREFLVEGQHSWWRYELAVEPGDHTIRLATVDPSPEAEVVVPVALEVDRRWVVIDFWAGGDEGEARFTAHVSNSPVAFA